MKSDTFSIVLVLVIVLASVSCDRTATARKYANKTESNETDQQTSSPYDGIVGQVDFRPGNDWITEKLNFPDNASVERMFFSDARTGWAINRTSIFRTDNGGDTWVSVRLKFINNAAIKKLEFIDDNNGWLILQDKGDESYSFDAKIRIYRSRDGGQTWELNHTEDSAYFRDAVFTKSFNWLVANKYLGSHPQRLAPLVISTTFDGSKWTDHSEAIIKISQHPAFAAGTFPQLVGVAFSQSDCIVVADSVERVFQSCDGGETWKTIFEPNSPWQPGDSITTKIRVFSGQILSIKGVGGIDQPISTELVISPLEDKTHRDRISIPGILSSDVALINSIEILLVGSSNSFNGSFILHSSNAGKSWGQIFKTFEEIKGIQVIPSNNLIFAITNEGTAYKSSQVGNTR